MLFSESARSPSSCTSSSSNPASRLVELNISLKITLVGQESIKLYLEFLKRNIKVNVGLHWYGLIPLLTLLATIALE